MVILRWVVSFTEGVELSAHVLMADQSHATMANCLMRRSRVQPLHSGWNHWTTWPSSSLWEPTRKWVSVDARRVHPPGLKAIATVTGHMILPEYGMKITGEIRGSQSISPVVQAGRIDDKTNTLRTVTEGGNKKKKVGGGKETEESISGYGWRLSRPKNWI